jgi:hypothetical protein
MKDFYISDDFISESEMKKIKDTFTSSDFPWTYSRSQIDEIKYLKFNYIDNVPDLEKVQTAPYMTTFIKRFHEIDHEEYYEVCKNLLEKFLHTNNLDYEDTLIVRSNIFFQNVNQTISPPHKDFYGSDHKIFLYYINDSDGDTLLFDNQGTATNLELKISKRVSPKMGRAISFNGDTYHSAGVPKQSDDRIVINISYK